jgi:hypothetical protein
MSLDVNLKLLEITDTNKTVQSFQVEAIIASFNAEFWHFVGSDRPVCLFPPICATFHGYLIFLDFITLLICHQEYKLWASSLCNLYTIIEENSENVKYVCILHKCSISNPLQQNNESHPYRLSDQASENQTQDFKLWIVNTQLVLLPSFGYSLHINKSGLTKVMHMYMHSQHRFSYYTCTCPMCFRTVVMLVAE